MHWTMKEKQILRKEVDQGQLYPEIVKKHFPHRSVERARKQVQSLQRLYPGKRESEILELLVQEHGNLDPGITPSASEISPTGNSVESQQNRRAKSKWTAADSQKLLKEMLKGYTVRIIAEQLFPGWNAENVKGKLRLLRQDHVGKTDEEILEISLQEHGDLTEGIEMAKRLGPASQVEKHWTALEKQILLREKLRVKATKIS